MKKIVIKVTKNPHHFKGRIYYDCDWFADAFIGNKRIMTSWSASSHIDAYKTMLKMIKKYYKRELDKGTFWI